MQDPFGEKLLARLKAFFEENGGFWLGRSVHKQRPMLLLHV